MIYLRSSGCVLSHYKWFTPFGTYQAFWLYCIIGFNQPEAHVAENFWADDNKNVNNFRIDFTTWMIWCIIHSWNGMCAAESERHQMCCASKWNWNRLIVIQLLPLPLPTKATGLRWECEIHQKVFHSWIRSNYIQLSVHMFSFKFHSSWKLNWIRIKINLRSFDWVQCFICEFCCAVIRFVSFLCVCVGLSLLCVKFHEMSMGQSIVIRVTKVGYGIPKIN